MFENGPEFLKGLIEYVLSLPSWAKWIGILASLFGIAQGFHWLYVVFINTPRKEREEKAERLALQQQVDTDRQAKLVRDQAHSDQINHLQQMMQEQHSTLNVMAARIVALQGEQAGIELTGEQQQSAIAALSATGEDLANRAQENPQAQAAFKAMEQGQTDQAYRLYGDIFDEESRAGSEHNLKAAIASRHLASLVRLTNVASAAYHYGEAAKLDPSHIQTWIDFGDFSIAAGNLTEAGTAFETALVLAERNQDAGSSALLHDRIGDVLLQKGDLNAALTNFQKSLGIVETLANSDRGNTGWLRDLSISYEKISDILVHRGELDAALTNVQKSFLISETLANSDRENTEWQRDLSFSYKRVAEILIHSGDLDAALSIFQKSLQISETLANSDRENTRWQRDLSVSYERIADILLDKGEFDTAHTYLQKSLGIREALANIDKENAGWQRDLSNSYDRISEVLVHRRDLNAALTYLQKSLWIREALVNSDRENADWQRNLWVSYIQIADVEEQRGNKVKAIELCETSLAIVRKLVDQWPDHPGFQSDLATSIKLLEFINNKQ